MQENAQHRNVKGNHWNRIQIDLPVPTSFQRRTIKKVLKWSILWNIIWINKVQRYWVSKSTNVALIIAVSPLNNTDLVYIWHVVLSVRSRVLPTLTIITCNSEFLLADSRAQPSLEDKTSLGLDSMKNILFSPISTFSMSTNFIFLLHNVSMLSRQSPFSLLSRSTWSPGHVSPVSDEILDWMPEF